MHSPVMLTLDAASVTLATLDCAATAVSSVQFFDWLGRQEDLRDNSAEIFFQPFCMRSMWVVSTAEPLFLRTCRTPRQPLQHHPSGHLRGWATLWLVEEMLDGQHQRVDVPAHARTAHNGLLQTRLEEDLCRIVPQVSLVTQSVKGLNWSEKSDINVLIEGCFLLVFVVVVGVPFIWPEGKGLVG